MTDQFIQENRAKVLI